MGQLLYGSARTTAAVRGAIQRSQARMSQLAEQYDINPKTAVTWKKRDVVHDAPMGPVDPSFYRRRLMRHIPT